MDRQDLIGVVMRINIRLFAVLRERVGMGELWLDLPTGATVTDASEALANRFPKLRGSLTRTAFAVNRSYVDAGVVLSDGDELALIPPVSGG
jgi:molybdopterin converting factor subunit 1